MKEKKKERERRRRKIEILNLKWENNSKGILFYNALIWSIIGD